MPWQMTARSGILHDGLYRWFEEWEIPRGESDGLYYESRLTVGAPRWRAYGQWSVLRGTGWAAWNRWRETRALEPGTPPPAIIRPERSPG